jgi:hypothetical protein
MWVDRFVSSEDRSKALVFISDWWDSDDVVNKSNIEKIIEQVKGITYFVVWVWTNKWWKIITWRDAFGRYSYQRYNWDYVVSKINKNNLKDIASSVDWDYIYVNEVW